jgi:hypothetical protein
MRNGIFHTPKSRGKFQKMDVLYTYFPKCQAHPHIIKKIKKIKIPKLPKKGASLQHVRLWATVVRRPRTGAQIGPFQIFPPSSYPHIFAHVIKSC